MAKRKYSGIFTTPITPTGDIAMLKDRNDADYARFQADVGMSGGTVNRTVMAFGQPLQAVRDMLHTGQTVQLAVQCDGGTIKIVGLPREKAAD